MRRLAPPAVLALLCVTGCSTAYYAAAEQIGWAPHDVLANRVAQANDAIEAAGREIAAVAARLRALAEAQEAERPRKLADAESAWERASELAGETGPRLAAVRRAGAVLSSEWEAELDAVADPTARRQREAVVDVSRRHYEQMLEALQDAEDSLPPMLAVLQSHLAPLRRHLDVTTLTALRQALPSIDAAVAELDNRLAVVDALTTKYVTELEQFD